MNKGGPCEMLGAGRARFALLPDAPSAVSVCAPLSLKGKGRTGCRPRRKASGPLQVAVTARWRGFKLRASCSAQKGEQMPREECMAAAPRACTAAGCRSCSVAPIDLAGHGSRREGPWCGGSGSRQPNVAPFSRACLKAAVLTSAGTRRATRGQPPSALTGCLSLLSEM